MSMCPVELAMAAEAVAVAVAVPVEDMAMFMVAAGK